MMSTLEGNQVGLYQNGGGDVLHKFELAKEEMTGCYLKLKRSTNSLASFFAECAKAEVGVTMDEKPVREALDQIDHISGVISRDQMKVAFFGRTSSGKSTVANAMLGSKILPVGMGDTTNCFITMQGTPNPEPYMIHPLHPDKPQSVHSVAQLAHALDKNKLQRSSQLAMFWPAEKVPLLQHDIMLIDSPGISVDVATDTWIDKYCLDADVFIFVANADSTIMEAEKAFFFKVSQHLSNPNIFILQNKWDLSDGDDGDVDDVSGVREQHINRSVEFLVDELKVMEDVEEARNRVFFISAREELAQRSGRVMNRSHSFDGDPEQHERDVQARHEEFAKFEQAFQFCVCDSAIRTKFEKHTQKGLRIMKRLLDLLSSAKETCGNRRLQTGQRQDALVKQHKAMKSRTKKLEQLAKTRVAQLANDVRSKIATAMGDEFLQLNLVLEKFTRPFPDDSDVEEYKRELYEFLDRELKIGIEGRYSRDIFAAYDQLRAQIIDQARQIMPEEWLQRSGPNSSAAILILTGQANIPRPELNLSSLSCASLCHNFQEDLNFNFSLSFSNIMSKIVGPRISRCMMQRQVTRPGQEDGRTGAQNAEDYVLPVLTTLSMLPSKAPLALVIVGGMVWSKLSWRVIVGVGAVYGGVYAYEKLTWNAVAKHRAFKRQFAQFARPQLASVIPMMSSHCSERLAGELNQLHQTLRVDIDAALKSVETDISSTTQEITKLNEIITNSSTYIEKLEVHRTEFEGFVGKFLGDSGEQDA